MIWLIILTIIIIELFACAILYVYSEVNYGIEALVNIKEFHSFYKVNWFGAFLITLLINIICFGISIPYWIKFICTVGRK